MSGQRPPTLDEVTLAKEGEDVHTFSNGTEWDCWADANCYACRWWNPDAAGADCAFEGAALLGAVTPELAAKFGWLRDETGAARWCKERNEADDPRDWWEAPEQCAFFMRRNDGDSDDRPDPPAIDPLQITFLAPDGWPDAPTPSPLTPRDKPAVEVPIHA